MKKETSSNWEIRDRRYTLRNNMEPLTFTIPSKHTRKHSLLYFDEESGKQKELRYATNQDSPDELGLLELQVAAMTYAKDIDIDQAEAILRVEIGSKVSTMGSKELKRDLLIFARSNPQLFIELVNDENVQLRNFAIKASEAGIISLSPDQRFFTWASNKKKLMTVPFDENPYSAMAAFFKTDEGVEIFKSIEKKFK